MATVFQSKKTKGFQWIIDSTSCETLEYCRLGLISVDAGECYEGNTEDAEVVLVILGGRADICAGERSWKNVGERANVFAGKATSVYVPIHFDYSVKAVDGPVQVAVCGVKADVKYEPFVIAPNEIEVHHRGRETWQREVHDIIGDNGDGRVHRIVIGETYGNPGGWSSYPPHKHDEVNDQETKLEEIYFFQIDPQQGFAVQLLYTEDDEICESHIVRHGDSFAIHKGYHPVAAAGGYRIYYLWFLGGNEGRTLKPFDEKAHRWLHQDK